MVSTIVRYLGQDNQAQIEPDQLTEESHQQLVRSINVPGIRSLPQNEINALRSPPTQTRWIETKRMPKHPARLEHSAGAETQQPRSHRPSTITATPYITEKNRSKSLGNLLVVGGPADDCFPSPHARSASRTLSPICSAESSKSLLA